MVIAEHIGERLCDMHRGVSTVGEANDDTLVGCQGKRDCNPASITFVLEHGLLDACNSLRKNGTLELAMSTVPHEAWLSQNTKAWNIPCWASSHQVEYQVPLDFTLTCG